MEVEKIATAVAKELAKRRDSDELHQNHHRWIEIQISKEQKKAALREKITGSVVGGVILMAISSLAAFGWWVIKTIQTK